MVTKKKKTKKSSRKTPISKKTGGKPKKSTSKKTARKKIKKAHSSRPPKKKASQRKSTVSSKKKGRVIKKSVSAGKKSTSAAKKRPAPKKIVSRISPKNRAALLKILLHKRALLAGNVDSFANQASKPKELNVSVDNMADSGTANYNQDFNLSLIETGEFTLAEIDEAIGRIRDGSFGICEECGTSIPAPRLEAIPYTRFCVTCQSERELF